VSALRRAEKRRVVPPVLPLLPFSGGTVEALWKHFFFFSSFLNLIFKFVEAVEAVEALFNFFGKSRFWRRGGHVNMRQTKTPLIDEGRFC
jgi:hypothetical protein